MKPYENLSLQDMEGEVWRDVVGYEGLYQVSNMGRVKSLERTRPSLFKNTNTCTLKERIIRLKKDGRGYHRMLLCKNGIKERAQIHRLIANAFLPNHENKPCINHINGIKHDNRVENLEWVTYSENSLHAYQSGLHIKRFGAEHWLSKPIIQKDKNGIVVKTYECSLQLVSPFKRTSVNRAIKSGKLYKGYYWESIS